MQFCLADGMNADGTTACRGAEQQLAGIGHLVSGFL
jgi:hypothetical protein